MKIIELGDFSRAAAALNITISALRHSVTEFERHCGEKLIQKDGKIIRPTHIGNVMYEKLNPLYRQAKDIIKHLPFNINNNERCLKVRLGGFYYPNASYLFLNLPEKLGYQYIISDSVQSCIYELRENACDIVICSCLNEDEIECSWLYQKHLSSEELGMLVSKKVLSKYPDIILALKKLPLSMHGSFFNQPSFYSLKEKFIKEKIACKYSGLPDFADILRTVENGNSATLVTEKITNYIDIDKKQLVFLRKPFPFQLKIKRSIYMKSNRFDEMHYIVDFLTSKV
ncbi:TPA: LysR family transcriptional regulator [Enterobacter bugandensis]|nr:LysR family transcriptional regulator [Enterobacter bugandensis]